VRDAEKQRAMFDSVYRKFLEDPVGCWRLQADLGEIEAARISLGGLLFSGTVTVTHEQHFLLERLKELESVENSSVENSTISSKP